MANEQINKNYKKSNIELYRIDKYFSDDSPCSGCYGFHNFASQAPLQVLGGSPPPEQSNFISDHFSVFLFLNFGS